MRLLSSYLSEDDVADLGQFDHGWVKDVDLDGLPGHVLVLVQDMDGVDAHRPGAVGDARDASLDLGLAVRHHRPPGVDDPQRNPLDQKLFVIDGEDSVSAHRGLSEAISTQH